ncbi:MAG: NAD(P)H-binding protein [Actinomycetaceae bacterium]|nr:NAD(P)H-binding protein [Actinomycetaceae bacterium]MDU0969776.1 NAD(P)H-binding protein [Actinomycetaceae bacterium]
MARVVIIGGHGKVALLAHPLLKAAGHEVDAVIRNPQQAGDVEAAGAHPIVKDIETLDAAGFDDLVRGYDVVVWSAGAGGGNPQRTYAVDRDAAIASMDAAGRVGVPLYVMVSYFGASLNHGISPDHGFYAYAEAKAAADQHLRESNLTWTILAPSTLTLDEPSGRIDTASTKPTHVSRGNVARAIVHAVSGAGTGRMVHFNDGDTPVDQAF